MSKVNNSRRILKIEIPHLPYPELSPNWRGFWVVKARAVKAAREEIGWLAKVQWHDEKPMMKARISYIFRQKDYRHRDIDNLLSACKSFQDGLIDVGVLFLDDFAHLELGSVKVEVGDKEETIIAVEEL